MGWARIDDSLHDHPKMIGLSLESLGLWVKCLSWAHRHHDSDTPGFLPLDIVKSFAGRKYVRLSSELVARQLWDKSEVSPTYPEDNSEISGTYLGDKSEISAGWWIHNYIDYLPAAEKPESASKVSKARSEAGSKGAEARWGKNRKAKTRSTPDSNLPVDHDAPDPTRPDPTRIAKTSMDLGDTYEREAPLSRSFPAHVVKIANRYTDHVMSDRSKVCTVVEMALRNGYLSTKVEDALGRLVENRLPVTPDTLRIEIEGKRAASRASPVTPNGYEPSTSERRASQALALAEKYRLEEESEAKAIEA